MRPDVTIDHLDCRTFISVGLEIREIMIIQRGIPFNVLECRLLQVALGANTYLL
jgi:hypothetical protein